MPVGYLVLAPPLVGSIGAGAGSGSAFLVILPVLAEVGMSFPRSVEVAGWVGIENSAGCSIH